MIIVRCKGGLGNQLFQYAAGRALAARHRVPLRIDAGWYGHPENQVKVVRTYDLQYLRIVGENATKCDLRAYGLVGGSALSIRGRLQRLFTGRSLWVERGPGFDPRFATLGPSTALEGYFQHWSYFASVDADLNAELKLREQPPAAVQTLARELSGSPSVCVQVRRGDYVTYADNTAVHGVCDASYYRRAWNEVRARVPDARAWVFTDDATWAHENLRDLCPVRVLHEDVVGPAFLHKFYLMQACRHFISANSTFGWWAARLGAGAASVVVVPRSWKRGWDVDALQLRLPTWIAC